MIQVLFALKLNIHLFQAIFILAITTVRLEASSGRKNLCLERTRSKLEKVMLLCLLE